MERSMLDLLLAGDVQNTSVYRPKKTVEVKRLSDVCGATVAFTLQALTFDEFTAIRAMDEGTFSARVVLKGCIDPDLSSVALKAHLGVAETDTPLKSVVSLLLDGEINRLSREIERLSGYDLMSVREIKND